LKVGILSDPSYELHLNGRFHPERPARLTAIRGALAKEKLLSEANRLAPRSATPEEVELAHHPSYIALVETEALQSASFGIRDGSSTLSTGDVQICPVSYEIALLAVGGVLTAIDALMAQEYSSVYCLVRPPGHHACSAQGMGFCLFNNAAVGARYALKKYGLERVLIVDWDVHHGNGTQEIFWDDPRVFYFSTHQWPLYPGTGAQDERGCGNILNCPINEGIRSRLSVLEAFQNKLIPVMEAFKPQCVFISAGFDAHERDPLGGMNLTAHDFGELTHIVKRIAAEYAEGRIISILEGGYDLEALASSSIEHVKALAALE
jgi:acetoin utilization deacetylase AcuC-like enzyme